MREKLIKYWVDCMNNDLDMNLDINRIVNSNMKIVSFKDIGVFGYETYIDFMGNKVFSEQVVYLKPEHRNYKNFKILLKLLENKAKEEKCNLIYIGSVNGYNDNGVLRLYRKCGYKDSCLIKRIK